MTPIRWKGLVRSDEAGTLVEDRTVLGLDKVRAAQRWIDLMMEERGGASREELFAEWLVSTAMGGIALDRINRFPKQKVLPLADSDETCPWEVVEPSRWGEERE